MAENKLNKIAENYRKCFTNTEYTLEEKRAKRKEKQKANAERAQADVKDARAYRKVRGISRF